MPSSLIWQRPDGIFWIGAANNTNTTLQVCHVTSNTAVIESVKSGFSDAFKEELGVGVLWGIKATIELKPTAMPCFCKNRPIPFALKEKVEILLKAQVDQGESCPVDKSEWATLIVEYQKVTVVFVYVVILKSQLTLSFALKYSIFQHHVIFGFVLYLIVRPRSTRTMDFTSQLSKTIQTIHTIYSNGIS